MRATLSLVLVLVLMLGAGLAQAQSNVGVEIDDVTDNRQTPQEGFHIAGGLELRLKVTGSNLDKALAARVIVKEAKDDQGNSLVSAGADAPDFMPREYNNGTLQVSVQQPARSASTVRLKGTVELYVPGRDPNAIIKIDKALSKLDAPLSSKALKTAKLELTPLSREGYTKERQARKITEKDIAEMRAEAKKRGVDEKELEMAIGLAQAFDSMDGDLPENAIVFSGKKADFDRIFRIEVLGSDGKPLNITSRSTSTRGESSLMTLNPSEAPPANAVLELMLLTDKSRMSFPFDLKVELP